MPPARSRAAAPKSTTLLQVSARLRCSSVVPATPRPHLSRPLSPSVPSGFRSHQRHVLRGQILLEEGLAAYPEDRAYTGDDPIPGPVEPQRRGMGLPRPQGGRPEAREMQRAGRRSPAHSGGQHGRKHKRPAPRTFYSPLTNVSSRPHPPGLPRCTPAPASAARRTGKARPRFGLGWLTWDEFVNALGGAGELNRRPSSASTSRVLLASLAQGLGDTSFGDFVSEPAFARAALELVLDLKAGRLTPRELQDAAETLPPERRVRAGCSRACSMGTSAAWRSWGSRTARTCCAARARPWCEAVAGGLGGRGQPSSSTACTTCARPGWGCCWRWRRCASRGGSRCGWRLRWGAAGGGDAALAALFRAFESRGETVGHVDLFKADSPSRASPLAELGRYLFSPR